ncbi:amino acid ABC transporter substrate-binding protein [Pseudomaricurvus sp. HS19]|uniref:amino acid ABC transporter substrate-binding protein n=1 Tax=Pseudomaricurvus sp. HS19 TaxID=2692626 RepID=UPI0013713908|nr:amino acid ABC transporter substrate-binding protein [Pseudomaricurvus sp. HS19]MYM61868.1 hypothetical protein [Pseudomaricurvus sp. HS19]
MVSYSPFVVTGRLLSCALLLVLSLSGHALAENPGINSDERDTITYLVYGAAAEPYQILNPAGLNYPSSGFISDLVRAVFSDSEYRIREEVKPIRRAKRDMLNGNATRWVAYALRSWEEEGVWGDATFAEVDLLDYRLSLMARASTEAPTPERMRANGVVWIQGYRYPGTDDFAGRNGLQFLRATDHRSAVRMVIGGRASYFMEESSRIAYALANLGEDQASYRFYPLDNEVAPTRITLLMSNDLGPGVQDFINQRLRQLQRDGSLQQLAAKYQLQGAVVGD